MGIPALCQRLVKELWLTLITAFYVLMIVVEWTRHLSWARQNEWKNFIYGSGTYTFLTCPSEHGNSLPYKMASSHLMIMRKGSLRKQQIKMTVKHPHTNEGRAEGRAEKWVSNESQTILFPDFGSYEIKNALVILATWVKYLKLNCCNY